MSFDPKQEDYLRLGVELMRENFPTRDFQHFDKALEEFFTTFQTNPDTLPNSDENRAFHLVSQATVLLDYTLPFSPLDQASDLLDRALALLKQATLLDDHCFDAQRMLAIYSHRDFESYYQYLKEREPEVKAWCLEHKAKKIKNLPIPELQGIVGSLAMRPYWRWAYALATKAAICGRYTIAKKHVLELLDMDSEDGAGAHQTGYLVAAKLEDSWLLSRMDFLNQRPGYRDSQRFTAWKAIGAMALAFKSCDFKEAESQLAFLLRHFDHSALALTRLEEVPDGVFCRMNIKPGSENELILALSEASILFQEGFGLEDQGALGTWVANHPMVVEQLGEDELFDTLFAEDLELSDFEEES